MSIADQITRLSNAKAAIKTSIENKGVTVGDDVKLDGYPALIDSIEAGGGSGETYVNPEFYELRTQNGTNFDNLFREYNGSDIDVSQWDTSKVTSARYCFYNCTKTMDINNWNLSSLRDSAFMFGYFTNGNKYIDLSVLDFSNVANVSNMFTYSNTDYLDVRNIKLSINSYGYLFNGCKGNEIDLSSWDISKVTDLSSMFTNSSFKKIDLTGWNTTNVKNFSSMFYGYSNAVEKLIIPDWDMTNATNTSSFIYTSRSVLKYIDLSRSNDLTINKIAPMLPKKTATTYGEILVPANTSQDAIDAVTAKYWKPIGPKIDLNSTEVALELDEIKPGNTTKVWTGNSEPWYGDDRLETIEFISSDESVATINGREVTGLKEGTVTITARRREDGVVVSTAPITLTVSETDSKPNLIKFRTNGSESSNSIIFCTRNENIYINEIMKDNITGLYYYELTDPTIFNIRANSYATTYITEFVKFNLGLTGLERSFEGYIGKTLDFSYIDTSEIKYMIETFKNCSNLTEIIGEIDMSKANNAAYAFENCPKLETLYLKNIYKNITMSNSSTYSINLGTTKVKDECLIYIINELPDLYAKGLTNTSNIILTLPPTNTLTAEQVQIAIDKGWQVANVNY